MSSQPNSVPVSQLSEVDQLPRLSYDEGWDLIFSLFGTAKEMYAEVGGAEAFMRAERSAWDQDDLR